jgi:hypothetical protein
MIWIPCAIELDASVKRARYSSSSKGLMSLSASSY